MIPRWLTWTLLALLCWGFWAVMGRLIGPALTAGQTQGLSTLGTLPVIGALAFSGRLQAQGNRTLGWVMGFCAGLLSSAGNVAYFAALNSGAKAATVIPLTALYPIVTVALAIVFLRERLRLIQWAGVGLAVGAIYLFNVPGEKGLLDPALVACAAPIGFWGLSGLLQKLSTNHIPGEASAIAFLAAFVPFAAVLLLREPIPDALGMRTHGLAFGLGLSLALGNAFILRAFESDGKASVIAPLAGLYPLASLPIVILALRERIAVREALGIALALAAVAAIAIEGRPADAADPEPPDLPRSSPDP